MAVFVKAHNRKGVVVKAHQRKPSVIRAYVNSKSAMKRLQKAIKTSPKFVPGLHTRLEIAEKNKRAAYELLITKYNRSRKFRGQKEVEYVPRSVTYRVDGGKKKSQAITKRNQRAVAGLYGLNMLKRR